MSLGLLDGVEWHDAGVPELLDALHLLKETLRPACFLGKIGAQDLDRHHGPGTDVPRTVDGGEARGAEPVQELVVAEEGFGGGAHDAWGVPLRTGVAFMQAHYILGSAGQERRPALAGGGERRQ